MAEGVNRVVFVTDYLDGKLTPFSESKLSSILGDDFNFMALSLDNDISMMDRLVTLGFKQAGFFRAVNQDLELFEQSLYDNPIPIAFNPNIQVTFNSDVVKRYRLLGYENRGIAHSNKDDNLQIELPAGHSVTVLYEVQLQSEWDGKDVGTIAFSSISSETDIRAYLDYVIPSTVIRWHFEHSSDRFKIAYFLAALAEKARNTYWSQDYTLGDIKSLHESAIKNQGIIDNSEEISRFLNVFYQYSQSKNSTNSLSGLSE